MGKIFYSIALGYKVFLAFTDSKIQLNPVKFGDLVRPDFSSSRHESAVIRRKFLSARRALSQTNFLWSCMTRRMVENSKVAEQRQSKIKQTKLGEK